MNSPGRASDTPRIANKQARRLWLHLQGILEPPHLSVSGQRVLDTVKQLGMVQLDSVNYLVRAHHHILWNRCSAYREENYNELLGADPCVFEHFSHDAAILPLDIYPYWQRQREMRSGSYRRGALGKHLASEKDQRQMLAQIRQDGPMCSRDFSNTFSERADKSLHAWMRPPHKLALDYLWLKGELAVSHRKGFIKYYELSDRLIPQELAQATYNTAEQIDFLCHSALQRLGFANAAEIQRFYEACDLSEVKLWIARHASSICKIEVEGADGGVNRRYAFTHILSLIDSLPEPSRRIRIISPFDPVVRDRVRLKELFGMTYRIEIYTPASQRKYGYYVCPMLEGDRICGRIDVRANRSLERLDVVAWWLEPGVKNSKGRIKCLLAELARLARLAKVAPPTTIPEPSAHP